MMDTEHTPGPWQVIVQEIPHYLGGVHVERRIFSDWVHPQLRDFCPVVTDCYGIPEIKGDPAKQMIGISAPDACLIAAAPEMLKVLQFLLKNNDEHVYSREAFQVAREIVAKATGSIA